MINKLTEFQKSTLRKMIQRQRTIMPHELCSKLLVQRHQAIKILEDLMQQFPSQIKRKVMVYCNCGAKDNAPSSNAYFYGEEKPKTMICKLCDQQFVLDDSVGFDEIFLLKTFFSFKNFRA